MEDMIIDVSDLNLDEVWLLENDSALAHVVRRFTAPADEDQLKPVSAFNSAL